MKINILISHIHMRTGGIETSLVNLLSMLDKDKYNIDLLLFYPDGELLELLPDWINVIPIWNVNNKYQPFLKKIVSSRNILCRVLKNIIFKPSHATYLIPKKHYDYAFAYSGYFNFMDTLAGIANANKKFIWVHADFYTQYNIDSSFRRKFKKMFKKYKYFDKIICVSERASENFKLLCPTLTNKTTYLWNINKKRKLTNQSQTNIVLSSSYNIITIARLAKFKGVERLVKVAKLLKDANVDFKIYVLGDGPNRNNIENMISSLGVENFFSLLGNINNIFPILNQADLYISPSDCEGFSNVTLESLISNVPIIATPTAGSIDIFNKIAPSNSMILTENFSEQEIYNKILLAKSGRLSKDFKFDIETFNKNVINEFEKRILS